MLNGEIASLRSSVEAMGNNQRPHIELGGSTQDSDGRVTDHDLLEEITEEA